MASTSTRVFAAAVVGTVIAVNPATAQSPAPPPAGLLAWWPMDGNAEDYGALALHGALAQAGGSFSPGEVLAGFAPTQPDGHIEVPDAPELRFGSDFTIEAWVRVDALPTGLTYLVSKGTADHRATPFALGFIGSDGALAGSSVIGIRGPGRPFVTVSDGTLDRAVVANQPLPLGSFAHIAFTVTDTQCAIYLNGSRRGAANGSRIPFAGLQSLRLGGIVGGNSLNGLLDEVTCYTRALSLAEIQAIHAAGPLGKVKPDRDRTPPAIAIDEPLANAVVGSRQLAVRATVTDDSATQVASIPDGVSAALPAGGGAATGAVTLTGPDGEHVVTVTATDEAGNTAATAVTVTLDTTAPVVEVLSPAAGASLGSSLATFAVAVDDLTATSVDLGGQSMALPPGQNAALFDVSLIEGHNAVTVAVTDTAGNRTVVVHDVVLDLSTPIVAIESPPDGALFGQGPAEVAVTVRVDDLSTTSVRSTPAGVSGALPAGGGLVTGLVSLDEGLNRIAVRVADELGNESETEVTVNLDRTAPGVTFASPEGGGPVAGFVSIQASAADIAPGSGVERIDLFAGSSLLASFAGAVCSFDLDTSTLADGDQVLRAVAVDGAGNAGAATLLLSVDNTPPSVQILEPVAGTTVSGTTPFVATATDGGAGVVSVVQRVGGRAPTSDGSTAFDPPIASSQVTGSEDTLQWPNGPLLFEVEATDLAGNTTVVEVEVDAQNQQGDGPGLKPRDGARVRGDVRIQVGTDRRDVIDLELQVDGHTIATGHGRHLRTTYDTTARMDGPMVVRALLRTNTGVVETVHTLHVRNLRVLSLSPHVLSLDQRGRDDVRVSVQGPTAALEHLQARAVQLRVPGGAAVAMRACGTPTHGGRARDDRCELGFDRAELLAAISAARATGALSSGCNRVWVQLRVDDVLIGRAAVVVTEGHRGSHR